MVVNGDRPGLSLALVLLAALSGASAQFSRIQPLSYSTFNGGSGTYFYTDAGCIASPNRTIPYAWLSGCLGELTDGLVSIGGHEIDSQTGGSRLVGFAAPANITWYLPAGVNVRRVRVNLLSEGGYGPIWWPDVVRFRCVSSPPCADTNITIVDNTPFRTFVNQWFELNVNSLSPVVELGAFSTRSGVYMSEVEFYGYNTISAPVFTPLDAGATSGSYSLSLNAAVPAGEQLVVTPSAAGITFSPASITFNAGEAGPVSFTAQASSSAVGPRAVSYALSGSAFTANSYATPSAGSITIRGFFTVPSLPATAVSGSVLGPYTVTINAAPAASVSLLVSAPGLTPSPASLDFVAGGPLSLQLSFAVQAGQSGPTTVDFSVGGADAASYAAPADPQIELLLEAGFTVPTLPTLFDEDESGPLTVSVGRLPASGVTLTPTAAPGSGVTFEPAVLSWGPSGPASQGLVVRTSAAVVAGAVPVTFVVGGADAANYVAPAAGSVTVSALPRLVAASFNTLRVRWVTLGGAVSGARVAWSRSAGDFAGAPEVSVAAGAESATLISLPEASAVYVRVTTDFVGGAASVSGPVAGPFSTTDPNALSQSPSGAAAAARTAAQAPAGGNALRQPAQNLTSVSGAPCLMDRCADGAFDVSCASRGGVHASQPRREWGWCGQLTLGKDISARDDASLCAALAAVTGVPCSRFRFVSAAAGSIVYQMQLLPAPGVACDPLQAGQIPDAVDFVDTTNAVQNGELRLDWDSNHHYESTGFDFVGASPACFAASFWSFEDVSAATPCGVRFTQRLPLTTALRECGFSGPTPVLGSATNDVYYETTTRITTVQQLPSAVFGQAVNRTNQASQRLRVQLPGSVNLTAGPISVFPAFENLTSDQANFAAITTQTFNTTANRATVRLVTSAAWPYVLTLQPGSPLTGGPSGFTKSASEISAVAITCDASSGAGQVCTQDWSLVFEANAATQCTLDGTYTVRFNVRCSLQFGNGDGCPGLQNSVTSVVFDLRSDNFCARVIEVANVQPSLVAYSDAGRTSPLTDYPFLSTVFMRLALQTEAGLAVSFVELTDVELRSHCTGCTGASVYPLVASALSGGASAYSFAYTAAPGQAGALHDFSFELNDASVQFDNNEPTGQVPLSVIAAVRVNYTDPAGQSAGSRVVRVEAALPSRSLPASASVEIGASGPARGTSSGSAAGGAGTVTVASVAAAGAAVAVVGVLVAAAVVVGRRRRRRSQEASRARAAAGSVSLSSSSAALVPGETLVETVDLRVVQASYSTVE